MNQRELFRQKKNTDIRALGIELADTLILQTWKHSLSLIYFTKQYEINNHR